MANLLSNKNVIPIVTKLFIRGRKPNSSLLFCRTKNFQAKFYNYIIIKISNKQEL